MEEEQRLEEEGHSEEEQHLEEECHLEEEQRLDKERGLEEEQEEQKNGEIILEQDSLEKNFEQNDTTCNENLEDVIQKQKEEIKFLRGQLHLKDKSLQQAVSIINRLRFRLDD